MTMSVVHIYDPDRRLGAFELLNFIRVARGPDIALHIDREDTDVEIVYVGRGGAIRDIQIAHGSDGCGCR